MNIHLRKFSLNNNYMPKVASASLPQLTKTFLLFNNLIKT